jgi:hypothetical protein
MKRRLILLIITIAFIIGSGAFLRNPPSIVDGITGATPKAKAKAAAMLAFCHFRLFGHTIDGQYILFEFTTTRLVTQFLLIAALFTHIFVNIRPLLVSLGIITFKERRVDIFLILSVFLLFFAGAVASYYIGWQYL